MSRRTDPVVDALLGKPKVGRAAAELLRSLTDADLARIAAATRPRRGAPTKEPGDGIPTKNELLDHYGRVAKKVSNESRGRRRHPRLGDFAQEWLIEPGDVSFIAGMPVRSDSTIGLSERQMSEWIKRAGFRDWRDLKAEAKRREE